MGRGEPSTTQLAGPQQGLPMTIRGGGNPRTHMVFEPQSRMGPPPRSFATDAHGCIMVRSTGDLPHTSLPRDPSRLAQGELASDICRGLLTPAGNGELTRPGKACRRARDRQGQVASRWGRMAPPILDRHCARRPARNLRSGRGDCRQPAEQGGIGNEAGSSLTIIAPYR